MTTHVEINDNGAGDMLKQVPPRLARHLSDSMKRSLALIEKHHKTEETVRAAGEGTRLTSGSKESYKGIIQPAVPDKVTSRTGTWSRGYTRRTIDRLSGGYGSGAKLAEWLEEGTKAHEIRPVKAKALRFASGKALKRGRTGAGGMGDYKRTFSLAGKVNHPGTQPRRTVQRTFEATQDRVLEIFSNGVDISLERDA